MAQPPSRLSPTTTRPKPTTTKPKPTTTTTRPKAQPQAQQREWFPWMFQQVRDVLDNAVDTVWDPFVAPFRQAPRAPAVPRPTPSPPQATVARAAAARTAPRQVAAVPLGDGTYYYTPIDTEMRGSQWFTPSGNASAYGANGVTAMATLGENPMRNSYDPGAMSMEMLGAQTPPLLPAVSPEEVMRRAQIAAIEQLIAQNLADQVPVQSQVTVSGSGGIVPRNSGAVAASRALAGITSQGNMGQMTPENLELIRRIAMGL